MTVDRKHQMGPGGTCLCPKCGYRAVHVQGQRCIEQRCPQCGAKMLREGSEHHAKIESKK